MKKLLLLIVLLLSTLSGYGQHQHKIDSLLSVLATTKDDTNKVNIFNKISESTSEYQLALHYAEQAISLSEKIGFKRGAALAYKTAGNAQRKLSNNLKALEYFQKSIAIADEIGDHNFTAGPLHNIGLVYNSLGNRSEALRYALQAKKINLASGNKNWLARNLTFIAGFYNALENPQEALTTYHEAMAISKEIGDYNNLMYLNYNIGLTYQVLRRWPEALASFTMSLTIAEKINSKQGMCSAYLAIGSHYAMQDQFNDALPYLQKALPIAEEIGDKFTEGQVLLNIGISFEKLKRYAEAIVYVNKGLAVAKEIGDLERIVTGYNELSDIAMMLGKYKEAYEYHKLFIQFKDSLTSQGNDRKLTTTLLNYGFEKTQDSIKAEQARKDALTMKEMDMQKRIQTLLIGSFTVVAFFLILVFRQRNNINKEKKISEKERERSDNLLLNILPTDVAEELKTKGTAKAKHFDNVTVLFTDFKSFTTVSEQLSPQELVDELHACFKAFDEIITKYTIEKIKTIGDAYLAVCGLPLSDEKHAENVVNAALEIREYMKNRRKELGEKTFEIRIGINSGSVVAGIVGVKKFAYDIWGDTVNTAARMEQNSEAGKINISETTYSLVKDQFTCEYRGEIDAKNKGMLKMYFVEKA
ncbi:MAG: tetratricopeptide repeat protein [Ignavibacteria bacterium]|nr:tetratricopeptide repeat protein [Ignavibacteria bacterium]